MGSPFWTGCPARCAARLFSLRTDGTVVGVALAALDDRNAFCTDRAYRGLGKDSLGAA
jgi:hypothetical protein